MMILALQAIDFSSLLEQLYYIAYKAIIFALIIFAGWIIGRVVGELVGRIVKRLGGDPLVRNMAIGRAIVKSGMTIPGFFKGIAKWAIYLAALLFALQSLEMATISEPVQAILSMMPRIVGAILIFVVGAIIADGIGELAKRSFTPEQRQVFYIDLLGNSLKVLLYFIVITITLSEVGIDVTILYVVAQAFAWGFAIFMGIFAGIIAAWLLKDKFKELVGP